MKLTRHLAVGLVVLAIGATAALSYFMDLDRVELAPDATFTRMDGTPAHVSQLRGKVVLVNFWATTCTICVKEMPQLVATHHKFSARGFETLAVAMSYDPPASVVNFTESRRLPFTVVIDNTGSVARSFGDVKLTPTTVLINKHGEIVKRYVGEPDFAALNRLIDRLLTEA
ncbi:MAG: TlpA family protein disulfide reductase [Rhizobacter sp.]|nr:TlpA family protein disulfide reductase [Rhizobacter sp.]